MAKYPIRRAEHEDEQCAANDSRGRCVNAILEGSQYCPAHGGNRGHAKLKKERKRLYDLELYNKRIGQFADHDEANTFREEIGVLRMLLQTRLQGCADNMDLMLHSQSIASLVKEISTAVTAVNKLEVQLGKVFTPAQAEGLVDEILDSITRHVSDPEVLEALQNDIFQALENLAGGDSGSTSVPE